MEAGAEEGASVLFNLKCSDSNGKASLVPTSDTGPASSGQSAFAGILGGAINDRHTITIGLTKGDHSVIVGSYDAQQIDVKDVAAAGNGPAVSGASMLAHEAAEQGLKQVLGLVNSAVDGGQQRDAAHAMANAAQSAVAGYQRGATQRNLSMGTGTIVTTHVRGNQV